MSCSDEEIPRTEACTKYRIERSNECGKHRLIVRKIALVPKSEYSPKSISREKKRAELYQNITSVHNMPRRFDIHVSDLSESVEDTVKKKTTSRKSSEKLNDQSISELLYDSESVTSSDRDDVKEKHTRKRKFSPVATNTRNEARSSWISSLRTTSTTPKTRKRDQTKTDLGKYSSRSTFKNIKITEIENDSSDDNDKKITHRRNVNGKDGNRSNLEQPHIGVRCSQRKRKSKFDNCEWEISSLASKGRNIQKRSFKVVESSDEASSSDEKSLDCRLKSQSSSVKKNFIKTFSKLDSPKTSSRNHGNSPLKDRNVMNLISNDLDDSDAESEDSIKMKSRSKIDRKEKMCLQSPKTINECKRESECSLTKQSAPSLSRIVAEKLLTPSSKGLGRENNKSAPKRNSKDVDVSSTDDESEDSMIIKSSSKNKNSNAVGPQIQNSIRGRKREEECSPDVQLPSSACRSTNERLLTPLSKRQGRKIENECTPKGKSTASQALRTSEKPSSPKTPISRRGVHKRQVLTPSMPTCERKLETPHTPLQEAMVTLHVSAVPKSLPCREAEFANIHRFLEGKILDGAGGCIYISGVPGTGKTATVREVVQSLKEDVDNGDLPNFQFIEINGMSLSQPRQAYVSIWKALCDEVVTAEQAQRLLETRFTRSSSKQIPTVLLVDEVDVLWTKRQDVVYNLLDWPTKAKAHLVVITIANTMDLPERLLMGRVTSRLGLTRLTFQPYTYKQLEEIVKARLRGINAFDDDAIQFVSRKVASVSGDARRALDICRRATEIAEQESPDTLVTIKHVDEAMAAMTSSHSVQAIMHACSTIERLFLQAVEAELNRTGLEETTFSKAFKMMETLCSLEGLKLPCVSIVMRSCMNLSSMRLLLAQNSNMDIYTRIFLNVSTDDLHYALKRTKKDLKHL